MDDPRRGPFIGTEQIARDGKVSMTNGTETRNALDQYSQDGADLGAWVGCLSCYNDGALVGEWIDATMADDAANDPEWQAATHEHHGRTAEFVRDRCEEWWVMDHEGFGSLGECGTASIQASAKLLTELSDDDERAAFVAYCAATGAEFNADGLESHRDNYCGKWDSFKDYAQEMAGDYRPFGADSETARVLESWPYNCIDWDQAARELEYDYTVVETPSYDVWVWHA